MNSDSLADPVSAPAIPAGHPRGIYTLFFTEMWERMSYYGMRGLLLLYMAKELGQGGLGLPLKVATAIYGLYVCAVYLVALPGGWVADRLLGQRRSVLWGGIIIALGHFTLAIPRTQAFFAGLLLVVLGTALLKPSASTMVGALYPEGGARRDAGFTLFYMGVNLGAIVGPLVCGALAQQNWHYGFGAAGIGMTAGVIQYIITSRSLGTVGQEPPQPLERPGLAWLLVGLSVATVALLAALAMSGRLVISPIWVAKYISLGIVGLAAGWFAWNFAAPTLAPEEKKRLVVIAVLFMASALFWCGFEQAGSSLSLFADSFTRRTVLGWEVPATWFQSINPVFVISFAPVFSWLWLVMARRAIRPSLAAKFATGLFFLAAGFSVMYFGSRAALAIGGVSPGWLICTYLLLTWGELALSPVGLSAVTKLAPARLATQAMGVWFLATSLGNLLAGLAAGQMADDKGSGMPALFGQVALLAAGVMMLLALFAKPLRRLAGGRD